MLELFRVLIYYPFLNLLTIFIWLVPGHHAAWGIILLTLLVRLILIIPSKKSAQAQRKMAELQPLLDELKAEYGDDKQGLAVAQMELYKKNNINPFGSCLPVLIQFPVIIVLYQAILHGITPNNPNLYSWVPRPPFIETNFFGIDLLKPDNFFVLPVIAAALQYLLMRMTLPAAPKKKDNLQPDPNQAAQRMMVYIFPAMTFMFARSLPAGVALYWVVTTIFSIAQQYYVNKEKLKLTGVTKALETVEKKHPEHAKEAEKAIKEFKSLEETSVNKGVTVTVRKKTR